MRVEMLRQPLGDAGNSDVPADMPYKLAFGQPEIAERARNEPSVVVAGEKERRAAGDVEFTNRWNILAAEK